MTFRNYDSLNRIIQELIGTGFATNYSYDYQNRLTEVSFLDVKIAYQYTPTQLTSVSRYQNNQFLYTYSQTHNLQNKPTQITLPNQAFISYHWDKKGRCIQIDSPTHQQSLTYDALGNLTQTSVQDPLGSYTSTYSYDHLNQLIQETGPFTQTYNYDSVHNRRFQNSVPQQVDTLNQILQDGINSYSYDLNSRRTAKGDSLYTYDALGRLTSFVQGSTQITYKYDPFGRLIEKRTPSNTVFFLYQLDTELGLYNDGLKEFRILHGKTPLAIELAGLLYTPIKNHRGDICQLLTFQGPAATYRYNAFGLYTHSGNIDSPWLFSSQRYDYATSLYHFDKREYDPHIGRWLTPDPLGFADGPNLYAYVNNNPLIYVDPYGLFWAEAGEFSHGFTRGFCDDTTLGGSSYLCGNYHSPSTLGNWGYHVGTGTSIAAGLLYGGAEVRLLKGAATGLFLGANKIRQSWLACNQATTTAKALHETHQVAKLASETAVPTILKVSQTAERSAVSKGWVADVKGGMAQTACKTSRVVSNPLNGTCYNPKVINDMRLNAKTALPDFHGFPRIVDNYAKFGCTETLIGHNGITRTKLTLPGGYQGREGSFEWIIEQDRTINHRLFLPDQ